MWNSQNTLTDGILHGLRVQSFDRTLVTYEGVNSIILQLINQFSDPVTCLAPIGQLLSIKETFLWYFLAIFNDNFR